MKHQLTPRQLALATGVSESSIKRWCDAGDIATFRTPGGHRRIPLSGAMQFIRGADQKLLAPEALGLPAGTHTGVLRLEEARSQLGVALEAGDETSARRILFDLYLNRRPISEIGDHVIAPAFANIGHRWESGAVEVFQERRAFELMRNLLHELRLSQTAPRADAPIALGGTGSGDSYALAPILVELVLRETGWRASYLGTDLPITTLVAAIREQQPRLFWLSVSHLPDESTFVADYHRLRQAAAAHTRIVLGGRALSADLLARLPGAAHCNSLAQLESFAASLPNL